MSEITLGDIQTLNKELAALAEVGVPSNLAPGGSRGAVAGVLDRINASLVLRSSLGQSLVPATADNQDLPPVYRSALEVGLRTEQLSATLDGMSRQVDAVGKLRSTIGRSMIPPLIVLALAYVGFVFLCLVFSPRLEGMYEQMGRPNNGGVALLVAMRNWLPYWATLLPVLVLGAVILWLRGWGGWQRLIPGVHRYVTAVRNANFANQLSLLTENNIPLTEGLPLAAAVTNDAELMAAAGALSDALAKQEKLPADAKSIAVLPPLLRWALTTDLGDQSLPDILRFAEKTYRHAAERRLAVWRLVLPAMCGALLGGSMVLAYGLCVFGPFVRLLEDLSY